MGHRYVSGGRATGRGRRAGQSIHQQTQETRSRRTPDPAPAEEIVQPVRRAGKPILLVLGLLCAGIFVLVVVKPFAGPDREQHEADPPQEILIAEGLEKEMFEVARKQMAEFPDDPTPVLLVGISYFGLGKNVRCRQWLSDLYVSQQKWSKVLGLQRELVQINPDYAVVHLNSGVAHLCLGNVAEAEKAVRQSPRLAPRNPAGQHTLV